MSLPSITDALSEALDTARRTISERLGNPFVFAFLASWCVFNYRIVMVVFGSGTTQEKLALIDWIVRCTEDQGRTLWCWPLLFAGGYQLLDIAMVAAAKWLANAKQRIALAIDQKQPIPLARQADFFADLTRNLEAAHAEARKIQDAAASDRTEAASVIGSLNSGLTFVLTRYHQCLAIIHSRWQDIDEMILTGAPDFFMPDDRFDKVYGPGVKAALSVMVKAAHANGDEVVLPPRFNHLLQSSRAKHVGQVTDALVSLGIVLRTFDPITPKFTFDRHNEAYQYFLNLK